jgi:signal transduction histidine kinase
VSDIVQDLEIQVSTAADPKEKIDLLNRLAVELSQRSERNLPKAIALCEAASELAQEGEFAGQPYQKGLAESLQNLGEFYLQLSHFDLALSFLQRAQSLLKEIADPNTNATIYNALGITFAMLGDAQSALENYNKALDIYRDLNQVEKQSNVLNNISKIYLDMGEHERALEFLNESLELARQAGAQADQATALAKMAGVYFSQGAYPQAQECSQQSRQLYRDTANPRGEAEVQVILGDIFLAMGEQNRAVDCYQAALALAQKEDYHPPAIDALFKLGEIYRGTGQPSEALSYLKKACDLAGETNHRRALYESHRALSLVYQQLRDFEKAFLHFEQFYTVKEEITNQEVQNRQKNLEILYQVENARKESEIFQLKNVTLQEEIRQRQEIEKALTQTNQQLMSEVASREQLIDDLNSFSHMVAHDLKNPLTNIALTAGVLRMSVTLSNDKVGQEAADRLYRQVEKINRIINELLVLASVRKEDVYTQPLKMGAIITEVEFRLERMIQEQRAEIRKPAVWPVASGHAPWVEEVWENYLSNAIHYGGRPPIVEVGADQAQEGLIRFWVRDNGRGLTEEARSNLFSTFNRNSSTRPSGHGLGLSIVKRIVDKLGGSVGVENECPGEGCLFYFTLPAAPDDFIPPDTTD